MLCVSFLLAIGVVLVLTLFPGLLAPAALTRTYIGIPGPDGDPAETWDIVKATLVLWAVIVVANTTNILLGWVGRMIRPWVLKIAPWVETERADDRVVERLDEVIRLLNAPRSQPGQP